MKNIRENIIVSNSFINSKNIYWKNIIDKNQKLNFLDMNEFNGVLKNMKSNSTINLICFFQEMTKDENSNKIQNFSNFLKNIEKICSRTTSEVIITASFWRKFSNISFSRNNTKEVLDKTKIIKKIRKLQVKFRNLYLIDIDNFFAEKGYEQCFSNRDYYLYSSKISNFGLNILINKIDEIYQKNKINPLKVLVFDCDNTLWGGVIGENGINKIKIGQDGIGKVYSDFQKTILNLSKQGYLICISSKNNHEDVIKVFEKNKMMTLKKKNIISFKINWKSKYKNIVKISKELNLGLNSFLFWDDNPLERQQMKNFLPEVNTIDVHNDITEWSQQLKTNLSVAKFEHTNEDSKKLKQYKILEKFTKKKKEINSTQDEINFLQSIKLSPKLLKLENSYVPRAAQMTQKTTQYNFRTKIYSETDLEKIKKNKDYFTYLVSLKDTFGDHGIISMFILKKINKQYVFLDTMLMSCRVLGRYLDYWILNQCRKIAKKERFKFILSEFIKTKRNKNFENSLKKNGFKKIEKKFIRENLPEIKIEGEIYFSNTNQYKLKLNKIF
jgi:FkbH-like protein